MVVELEERDKRPDPTTCPHASINRVLDEWICNECGAEFVPKNPDHKTEWPIVHPFERDCTRRD
jgi:acetone carboxylase gamma subunit